MLSLIFAAAQQLGFLLYWLLEPSRSLRKTWSSGSVREQRLATGGGSRKAQAEKACEPPFGTGTIWPPGAVANVSISSGSAKRPRPRFVLFTLWSLRSIITTRLVFWMESQPWFRECRRLIVTFILHSVSSWRQNSLLGMSEKMMKAVVNGCAWVCETHMEIYWTDLGKFWPHLPTLNEC